MHHAVEISLPRARIDLARRGAWSAAIRRARRVPGGAVATKRRAQLIKGIFWTPLTLTPAFAISGQSGSGPRWGFIEVETTVGLPAAQSRPRMRAVPGADPFFVSRRSCGYQKPKRAILLCLSARHKRNKRHRTRKRKSHREIKRAPRGKWLGRRVRNGVDFGARWFFGHVASSEARVGVR